MPININDQDYVQAERDYYDANTLDDQIDAVKRMISHSPNHKGGENLRKQLKARLKKLLEKQDKGKKSGKGGKAGIKKEDMQAAIIGFANTGKSTLLSHLTNAKPKISKIQFSTTHPIVGMMGFAGTGIQLIEIPAIESEYYDKGIPNTADTILILVTKIEDIPKIKKSLDKSKAKQIIVFNKMEPFTENQRKLEATLSSKKYNHIIISTSTKENYEALKNKLFESFGKMRVFTKEPGKEASKRPIVFNPGATIENAAEKILKGFARKVKETKIWGPSSKFSGQKVGLKHKLKDMDIVEFKTQ